MLLMTMNHASNHLTASLSPASTSAMISPTTSDV